MTNAASIVVSLQLLHWANTAESRRQETQRKVLYTFKFVEWPFCPYAELK